MGPALFSLPLRSGLVRLRTAFETEGVEAFAYMSNVSLGLVHVTASTVAAVPFLRREMDDIGITTNPTKTVALPPKGHVPTEEGIALLASVDVRITEEGGATVVGVPVGSNTYEAERAVGVVSNEGAERLASLVARMPDKQAAALIATQSLGQTTGYLGQIMNTEMTRDACKRPDNGALWAYEHILELPGAAEAAPFFEEGCPTDRLKLQPHQQAQACLSTGAGRLGLSSAEARRMSASIASRVGLLPVVLADVSGPLGGQVRRELPASVLNQRLGTSLRELRDEWGVSPEAMDAVVRAG